MVPVWPVKVNRVELVGRQTLAVPDNVPGTVVGEIETKTELEAIEVEHEGVDEEGSTIQ